MEYVVMFFRDTLSGWVYVLDVIICLFLIFAIIGYLLNNKYNSSNNGH